MATWGRDEGRSDSDKVIVHIARIAKGRGGGSHDNRHLDVVRQLVLLSLVGWEATHQLIRLLKRWFLNMESICNNA